MDDLIRQAVTILRGVWQRRWIGLAVAWLVGVAGIVVVLRIPEQFDASARIYVNTESILKPLMSGLAVQPNIEQQVGMLSRTLLKRSNVEELVRRAKLDLEAKPQAALVDNIAARLEIQGAGRDNLYTLSFRDTDPARAKRVVGTLASIFVESNRSASLKDSTEAKNFIEGQIQSYEKKLEEAENRLKEFKLRHLEETEGGQNYFAKMDAANVRLNEARLALREAEDSRNALKQQIAGEAPVSIESKAAVSEIDERIASLSRNLDSLLQRFTEQHPDVVGTRRILAQLEVQRAKELRTRDEALPSKPIASTNPVYQELKVALAKAEAVVASLRARVTEYERSYQQLMASGRQVPEVEAELAQLNRDYEINKKNYEGLVARRESVQIAGEMDAAGIGDFRIIDPARVSSKPSPNRLLLLPLVLAGALGAGVAASFAASKLRPTFLDGASLREATQLPVLGTISYRDTEDGKKKARRGLIGLLSALGGLVAVYGAASALLLLLSMRSA